MARNRIANKFYTNDAGERSNTAQSDSTGFGFDFFDTSGAVDEKDNPIVTDTVLCRADEFPQEIQICSMLMGFLQKMGDAYAGKADEALEIVETMKERLMGGDWVTARAGGVGPRPSMLLDAMKSVMEAAGHAVTDAMVEQMKAAIGTDEGKKSALANPQIKAAYETLRAEKAAERAQAAAKKAAESTDTDFMDQFGA